MDMENGIMNTAKNPARTSSMIQVVGKSELSCNRRGISFKISRHTENIFTEATETTTNEQEIAVYVTNWRKNLYRVNPTIPPTQGQK